MQKRTFILLLALTTLAALAAAFLWGLAPLLTPLATIHDGTEADLIREIWPLRLVQPEWVSIPPNHYQRWEMAETLARLIVVFLGWVTTTTSLVRRYLRSHRNTPPMRCTQQPLRRAVERFMKLEHHHCRPRPAPAAVRELLR